MPEHVRRKLCIDYFYCLLYEIFIDMLNLTSCTENTILRGISSVSQLCVRIVYGQKCQFFSRDMTAFFVTITIYTEYGRQNFK
jgi:hypothetical protein